MSTQAENKEDAGHQLPMAGLMGVEMVIC